MHIYHTSRFFQQNKIFKNTAHVALNLLLSENGLIINSIRMTEYISKSNGNCLVGVLREQIKSKIPVIP